MEKVGMKNGDQQIVEGRDGSVAAMDAVVELWPRLRRCTRRDM
jgi:hypothetical protein